MLFQFPNCRNIKLRKYIILIVITAFSIYFNSCSSNQITGQGGSLHIAIIADTYPESPYLKPDEKISDLVKSINNSPAQFTFHMGNIIYAGDAVNALTDNDIEKQIFDQKRYFNNLTSILHIVQGDKDNNVDNRIFNKYFNNSGYYSFNCGDIHFIILDSNEDSGKISLKQMIWLEEDLQQFKFYPGKYVFIRDNTVKPEDWKYKKMKTHSQSAKLNSIFQNNSVTGVFSASGDDYFKMKFNNVIYINSPVSPIHSRTRRNEFDYHLIKLNSKGELEIKNMRLEK